MSRARDIADGTLNSADINGGTIDGADITVGSGKTLDVSAGTFTTSSINSGQIGGRRNLIINGAMQVAQRGTSFTSQTGPSYHLDRWKTEVYNLSSGQYSVEQSTDSPDGFHFSTKLSCTTSEPSQDVNNQMWFTQSIEGNNVQHIKFFQSNPDTVTFSFWVKSNTTGIYAFTLKLSDNGSSQNNNQTRIYATDFTIDSADTWEYKKISITLDGSTAETKVTNNTFSMGFLIWLSAGSSRQSTTPETWSNNANQAANTITADNFLGSTSNYFNITGVQLEVGSAATAFEHRSYGEELALCQRYYQHNFPAGYYPSDGQNISGTTHGVSGFTAFDTGNARTAYIYFSVPMRATPTITLYSASSTESNGKWGRFTFVSWVNVGTQLVDITSKFFNVREGNVAANMTAGYTYLMRGMWSADSEI